MENPSVKHDIRFRNSLITSIALLLLAFSVVNSDRTLAQAPAGAEGVRGTYRSDVDDLLTVQKVSVLPFTDNLQGIYARPLEAHFISVVEKMHRWDYVPATPTGPILSPEELESSPEKGLQVSQGLGVDAFFAVRMTKGPNGVMMHMSLFLAKDGKLLAQAILKDYKQFNIEALKEQMQILLNEIVNRLPYSGRVLSREGNRVTINLGTRDGIQNQQMLSVVQIIQAQRHPKFNFIVKTEKEIFGKIKVLKVEETLSFGVVVSEKERGAIQKNSKIGAVDFVTYGNSNSLSLTPSPEEGLTQREDSGIVFGKDAKPWLPTNAPTFGQVGGQLGLGRFNGNRDSTAAGAAEASNNIVPSVTLLGELWITQEWTFHAKLKQAIIPVENPVSSSSPGELNQSMQYYEAGAGYPFRLGPYIWSANVEPYLGFFYYRLYVDNSSPRVYTTMQYSGLKLGLRGSTPVGDGGQYGVGGDFSMAWNPAVSEQPSPSGDSTKGTVVQFGIFGFKRLGERLKLQANLDFEMYSSSFSGAGGGAASVATSASHRHTTLSGGVIFLF